jgi:predicted nucleic acid-binding protein
VNATPVLLDTSVWVHYIRRGGSAVLKEEVQAALDEDRVWTCLPIVMELLIGSRDESDFDDLRERLSALHEVALGEEAWIASARVGNQMRRAGVFVPMPDLLIAQAAVSQGMALWHLDDDFDEIARFMPLKTRKFSA